MRSRGRGAAFLLGAGLYALVVVVSPLLHHDLDCHVKSPSHCVACTANPFASRIERGASPDCFLLPAAGRVEAAGEQAPPASAPDRLPSRSPPA